MLILEIDPVLHPSDDRRSHRRILTVYDSINSGKACSGYAGHSHVLNILGKQGFFKRRYRTFQDTLVTNVDFPPTSPSLSRSNSGISARIASGGSVAEPVDAGGLVGGVWEESGCAGRRFRVRVHR